MCAGSSSPSSAEEDDSALMRRPEAKTEDATQAWRALGAVTIAMIGIGHCQYTWTLFVASYAEALAVTTAAVQTLASPRLRHFSDLLCAGDWHAIE